MQVKQLKCPNCGAAMRAVNDMPEVYCVYCGSRFTRQEEKTSSSPNQPQDPKVVYVKDNRAIPPRPRLNGCLVAFLMVMYVVPGFIYMFYVMRQQQIWDELYGGGRR